MRKIFLALFMIVFMAVVAMGQSRTPLVDGVFLAQYGNVYVIENERTQQSVRIKVTKEKSLYEVFCNDTLYRTVTKAGLKAAIEGAIIAASGGSTGSWVSGAVAGDAADRFYNWVCTKLK